MTQHNRQNLYLTIDDSPSPRTDELIRFLDQAMIPAILFCRGDLLEANPEPIIRAIEKGMIIGNHLYSHKRASTLGFEVVCEEILKTERLIDACYAKANQPRLHKFIRFPYMDRGMGAWVVEPDNVPSEYQEEHEDMIRLGLGNDPAARPDEKAIALKNRIQEFLHEQGFEAPSFGDVTLDWFCGVPEMGAAIDSMFTLSSSDWMLTQRHQGKWPYKTTVDVMDMMYKKMDGHAHPDEGEAVASDELSFEDDAPEKSAHILLMHDQEDIHDEVLHILELLQRSGCVFKTI